MCCILPHSIVWMHLNIQGTLDLGTTTRSCLLHWLWAATASNCLWYSSHGQVPLKIGVMKIEDFPITTVEVSLPPAVVLTNATGLPPAVVLTNATGLPSTLPSRSFSSFKVVYCLLILQYCHLVFQNYFLHSQFLL